MKWSTNIPSTVRRKRGQLTHSPFAGSIAIENILPLSFPFWAPCHYKAIFPGAVRSRYLAVTFLPKQLPKNTHSPKLRGTCMGVRNVTEVFTFDVLYCTAIYREFIVYGWEFRYWWDGIFILSRILEDSPQFRPYHVWIIRVPCIPIRHDIAAFGTG